MNVQTVYCWRCEADVEFAEGRSWCEHIVGATTPRPCPGCGFTSCPGCSELSKPVLALAASPASLLEREGSTLGSAA